jgi:hypothetical protein
MLFIYLYRCLSYKHNIGCKLSLFLKGTISSHKLQFYVTHDTYLLLAVTTINFFSVNKYLKIYSMLKVDIVKYHRLFLFSCMDLDTDLSNTNIIYLTLIAYMPLYSERECSNTLDFSNICEEYNNSIME